MPLTVLVTGANGFVGRVLCRTLQERGHTVRAAVRQAAVAPGIAGEPIVVGSIDAKTEWSLAVRGVDAVVHVAARVHVMRETESDPLQAFRNTNVHGTAALANAAAAAGVERFVYVSSIKVNGEATFDKPFTADDPPSALDAYGVSKQEAERGLRDIARLTGLQVTVVRPPLVYGPGVGGNFLRLLKLIRRGIPLPFGSIENRRSMIYNGNLADALVACATHANAAGKTYLVRDAEDLSTGGLVRRLAREMGTPARLWEVPPGILRGAGALIGRTAEVDRLIDSLVVEVSAIEHDLHWSPRYTVAEGLAKTAAWFSTHPL